LEQGSIPALFELLGDHALGTKTHLEAAGESMKHWFKRLIVLQGAEQSSATADASSG
jgi:hypothetical protein